MVSIQHDSSHTRGICIRKTVIYTAKRLPLYLTYLLTAKPQQFYFPFGGEPREAQNQLQYADSNFPWRIHKKIKTIISIKLCFIEYRFA
jgi:hypothetical protein